MKSMRGFVLVSVLALTAAACRGAGGGGAGGDELVFAIGGADAAPGGTHRQVIERWNQQHPDGPKVRIEQLPDEADQQRQQLALELQAQSGGFDILALDVIWTGEFAVNGWVEKLDEFRDQLEGKVLGGPLQSASWEGTLWAVPYNSNAGFLYYRTDLIDTPPRTWDETKRMGMEAAREARICPFVGQGFKYEGMVVNYLEYLWGAGGELLSEDGEQVRLGQGDAGARALQFMRDSQKDGFYCPGFNTMKEEEARNTFQSGKAVFMRNWPYAFTLMSGEEGESQVAGKFDIAPLPTFTGEGTVSALGGFNLGVSAFSDNKDAAKDFVMWAATDREVQVLLGKRTLPPVLESAYEQLSGDPVMKLLGQVLPDAKPRPPAPSWNQISEDLQQAVFPAYNGSGDINRVVQSLQQQIQKDLRS